MSGYDYGNARLRVMKSRLLTTRQIETIAGSGSIQGMIVALTKTTYRKPIETALARVGGLDCINEAIRIDLVNTFGNMRRFYNERPGEMIVIVLRTYDIRNLKTILRGLSKNASLSEIQATLIPIGELSSDILMQLTSAANPRGAIDKLVSLGSRYATPLIKLRAEQPGAAVINMELALDRWHYQEANESLKKEFLTDGILFSYLNLELDLINLLTALRYVHAPGERKQLLERIGTDRMESQFFGPGRLPLTQLVQVAEQQTIEAAVDVLVGTPYEIPLTEGLRAFARSGRLSEFERQLNRFKLDWASKLIYKDPLGIGVVLGYLELKTNEVRNLRWAAQGIHLGLKPDSILSEMELVR
jgi:V/A-type H+-transporting ATPase subunit C